jgi:hypothetical protein
MAEITPEPSRIMIRRVLDGQDRLERDMGEVKDRVLSVARAMTGMCRDQGNDAEQVVSIYVRVDSLSSRVDRVERRLDLVD